MGVSARFCCQFSSIPQLCRRVATSYSNSCKITFSSTPVPSSPLTMVRIQQSPDEWPAWFDPHLSGRDPIIVSPPDHRANLGRYDVFPHAHHCHRQHGFPQPELKTAITDQLLVIFTKQTAALLRIAETHRCQPCHLWGIHHQSIIFNLAIIFVAHLFQGLMAETSHSTRLSHCNWRSCLFTAKLTCKIRSNSSLSDNFYVVTAVPVASHGQAAKPDHKSG